LSKFVKRSVEGNQLQKIRETLKWNMSNDKKSWKIERKKGQSLNFFCFPFSTQFLQGNSNDQKIMQIDWYKKLLRFVKHCIIFFSNQNDHSYFQPLIVCVTFWNRTKKMKIFLEILCKLWTIFDLKIEFKWRHS